MIEVGVTDQWEQQTSPTYIADPALIAAGGLKWVRLPMNWFEMEPTQGVFDTHQISGLKAAYNAAGLKIIWNIINPPNWSNGQSGSSGNAGQAVPPTDPSTFAVLMAHLAATFPGETWELFNEPGGGVYFLPGGASYVWTTQTPPTSYAAQCTFYATPYVALVKAAYAAMKAADPTCRVIAGVQDVLDPTMFTVCAGLGMVGFYDVYSAHSYFTQGQYLSAPQDPMSIFGPQLTTLQATRVAAGDKTPLWIDEFGWPAYPNSLNTPPVIPGMVTADLAGSNYAAQANYYGNYLSGLNARGDIPVACGYLLRDSLATVSGNSDANKPGFYGIMTKTGVAKPAYNLIASMAANGFQPPPRYRNTSPKRGRNR